MLVDCGSFSGVQRALLRVSQLDLGRGYVAVRCASAAKAGSPAGSQLVILDDLGHVPQEEDPVRTVAVAKQFLGLNK